MIDREKVVDIVKAGREVTVLLRNATIVSIKSEYRRFSAYGSTQRKIIVRDPQIGAVWFSSFSGHFGAAERGDRVTLKVTVTGVGDPSFQYPDPILFAQANTRSKSAVTIHKHG